MSLLGHISLILGALRFKHEEGEDEEEGVNLDKRFGLSKEVTCKLKVGNDKLFHFLSNFKIDVKKSDQQLMQYLCTIFLKVTKLIRIT